jgi:hypothetical protein
MWICNMLQCCFAGITICFISFSKQTHIYHYILHTYVCMYIYIYRYLYSFLKFICRFITYILHILEYLRLAIATRFWANQTLILNTIDVTLAPWKMDALRLNPTGLHFPPAFWPVSLMTLPANINCFFGGSPEEG